jgi:hypothetical protein
VYIDQDMEPLVARLVPAAERATWKGASERHVAHIEELAGRPLPDFYRWFLDTMGGAFPHETLGYERQDLRAATVIEAYRKGVAQPDPRFLLIGRIPDPVMPELLFYDLDAPCRDDAMVLTRAEGGGPMRRGWQTLREKLAWGMLRKHRVTRCAQRCEGSFAIDGANVRAHLDPVMAGLGFTSPIPTGEHCALFEREDAAMACLEPIEDSQGDLLFFQLGGPEAGTLRRMLGELATKTPLEVRIDRWRPPLPA